MDLSSQLDLPTITTNIFIVGTLLYLMVHNVPVLHFFLMHVKTQRRHATKGDHREVATKNTFTVPKSYFLHFYVLSSTITIFTLATKFINNKTSPPVPSFVASLLLLSHLTRRAMECLFVHVWKPTSRMHVLSYLGAISYYTLVVLVVLQVGTNGREPDPVLAFAGVLMCLYGQYEQYQHHVLLADLGRNRKLTNDNHYTVPSRRWFTVVACPHYFAEILIYIGFAFVLQTIPCVAMVGFVVCDLSVAALATHEFYTKNIPEYASSGRRAIIPYLL